MADPVTGFSWIVRLLVSGSYEKLAAQRTATLNLTADEIDATSKDENAWAKVISGRRSWSIEMDAAVIVSNAAYITLLDAFFANPQTQILVEIVRHDGKVFRGSANITNISHELPYDELATYSLTLSGVGEPTHKFVAAA